MRQREEASSITITPPRKKEGFVKIGMTIIELQLLLSTFATRFGGKRALGLKSILFWYAGIKDAAFKNDEIELLDTLIPAFPKHTGKYSMRDGVLHRSLLVEVCFYTLNTHFDQEWCHNFANAIATSSLFFAEIKIKVTEICSCASSEIKKIYLEMMDAISNYEVRELEKRERILQEAIIDLARQQENYDANDNRSIANASHQLQPIQRLSYEPTTQKRNDNGFESIVNSFSNNRNQSHPTSEAQTTQDLNNNGFESRLSFHNNRNMSLSSGEAQTMRNRNNNGVESILNSFHNNRTQSHSTSEIPMTQNRNNNGFEPFLNSVHNDRAKLLLQQQQQHQHQHQQPPFGYEHF